MILSYWNKNLHGSIESFNIIRTRKIRQHMISLSWMNEHARPHDPKTSWYCFYWSTTMTKMNYSLYDIMSSTVCTLNRLGSGGNRIIKI